MTTALTIIKAAFRIAGITNVGEIPTAEEAQDALESLNDILGSVSNDDLMLYNTVTESFQTTSASEYTIGTGGDFDTTRPINIVTAYVRQGSTDYPVSIIEDEAYARIPQKQITSLTYFLNYVASFPLGKLRLYPAPQPGLELFLVNEKPLTTFTLNQQINMPPGWNRYLKTRLAIELAPEYGIPTTGEAVSSAREALGLIKRNAAKVKSMDFSAAVPRTENIFTGWYV